MDHVEALGYGAAALIPYLWTRYQVRRRLEKIGAPVEIIEAAAPRLTRRLVAFVARNVRRRVKGE